MKHEIEIKVGILVFVALILTAAFLWLLGDYTPLASTYNIYAEYNFAGGVELGTPVRVSGIKVGKVTSIEFLDPGTKDFQGNEIAIRLKLNISKKVQKKVRTDSNFYVNQAGIIGERYIEITPGSSEAQVVAPNSVVRGVDPPRFDQLISQSMGLFGEVNDIVEKSRPGIEKGIGALGRAGETLDAMVSQLSPEDMAALRRVIHRMDNMTEDLEDVVAVMKRDLGPTLYSVRRTLEAARPLLNTANRLLDDVDGLAEEYHDLPAERKEEIRKTLSDLVETTQHLSAVLERLDAFTAMVQDNYSDLDRAKIESLLRNFLQVEGIRVNVGEVHFKDKKE